MADLKRAISFSQARKEGLNWAQYEFIDVPDNFEGILEYKVWGKKMNLQLFFRSDDGNKYLLSAFRNHVNKKYTPRKMVNMHMCSEFIQPGMKFKITTTKTSEGTVDFIGAKELEQN